MEELIKPRLKPDRKRDQLRRATPGEEHAREKQRFFVWSGTNVFELIHPSVDTSICSWAWRLIPTVRDMVRVYAQLTIDLQEILFSEEGKPDGIWHTRTWVSSRGPSCRLQYGEIIQPGIS